MNARLCQSKWHVITYMHIPHLVTLPSRDQEIDSIHTRSKYRNLHAFEYLAGKLESLAGLEPMTSISSLSEDGVSSDDCVFVCAVNLVSFVHFDFLLGLRSLSTVRSMNPFSLSTPFFLLFPRVSDAFS